MFRLLPPATRVLLIANVVVYILESVLGDGFIIQFALWPLGPYFQPWQLITYGFLHQPFPGYAHIFFNMLALWMFGSTLEQYLGTRRYTTYYFVCLLAAGLTQLAVVGAMGGQEPTLGASGAIFGLLLAYAMFFPRQQILIFYIPMPAWLGVTVYGVIELFFGVTGRQESVAHFAHLGGMLGGAVMLLYWRIRGVFR
jgi:membrane associated rhomboid family serine protease